VASLSARPSTLKLRGSSPKRSSSNRFGPLDELQYQLDDSQDDSRHGGRQRTTLDGDGIALPTFELCRTFMDICG
jgi:hypothetical protein